MPAKCFAISFIAIACLAMPLEASVVVNQAGYLTRGQKIFLTTSVADSFTIIETSSGTAVFRGPLSLWKANDPATGLTVYKGNFSAFKQPGSYVISISPSNVSLTFSISDSVFSPVYQKALKGFYFQRCGEALPAASAGIYARSECHLLDGVFHASTDTTGFKLVSGGWHDAGDYGKYVVNAGVAVGTLLLSYELFPERFNQDNLGIPESGNGIPDILDEVQYELLWMLKMQKWNGGVYFKVTRTQFEGFVMPSADVGTGSTRYIYSLSTTATGDFAAVFAKAASLYRPFSVSFADTCLAAARSAWSFLQSYQSILPVGGFKNPTGTATGEYGDGSDNDERLWAAAELYSSTGEDQFQTYYSLHYNAGPLISQTMSWPNVSTLAHFAYYYTKQTSVNSSVQTVLRQSFTNYSSLLLGKVNGEGFSVAIKPGEYNWGSNSEVLNRAIIMILAAHEPGLSAYSTDFTNAALSQLDYILGKNAHDRSFVSGVGQQHLMHPHHRPSSADGIVEPVPGLLAGGPDQYLDDPVLKSKFSPSTPPALCYIDDEGSYASNEIAINWNAPLVFVAGYFAAEGNFSGVKTSPSTLPAGNRLLENFPNPFNPATTVHFKVPGQGFVSIKVYDSLGNELETLVQEVRARGDYNVTWNGSAYPSGTYFCRMQTGEYEETVRMILVR